MTFWTRTIPGMFLAFLIAIPLLGAASGGKEATREDFREISTAGADRLKLAVGAGFLHVIGEDSRNEIRMEAKITAMGRDRQMAEEILEEVEIRETRRGSTLTLKTRGPDELKRGGFRVDISIWIPSGMDLEISDGSGDIEVVDMRNGLEINDGSGDIEIQSLEGPLEISDGSGNIDLAQIRGEVSIQDGSGGIRIDSLTGSLDVQDGSGSITIRNVTGSTEVQDGSGNIDIRDVIGDVRISDGSGNIQVNQIDGNLRIDNDGSGSLQIGEVSGRVEKP